MVYMCARKHTYARTCARTHTRAHTLCFQTTKFWSKLCTYSLYVNIFMFFYFVFVYFAYQFSVNVCVYIATCKMFIVQLFIKCSSFIGGIKLKVRYLFMLNHCRSKQVLVAHSPASPNHSSQVYRQ